jgi:hypothetical protein
MNCILRNNENIINLSFSFKKDSDGTLFGGDAVYIARLMLNIDEDNIQVDYSKAPPKHHTDNAQLSVKLYPNPAKDEIMIEFDNALKSNAILEVYGYTGNLIQTQVLSFGYQFISVSTKDLKAGLYMYRILDNEKILAKDKLLIIK